jgi:hypothetical protein
MATRTLLASLLTLSLLAACGRVPLAATPSPLPEPIATATFPAPTLHAASFVLRVWVTPRFDPAADSLFQARLDAFAADRGPWNGLYSLRQCGFDGAALRRGTRPNAGPAVDAIDWTGIDDATATDDDA